MKVKLIFAWYDIWIGFFWDSKKKWLYFFPLPMIGIIIKLNSIHQLLTNDWVELHKEQPYSQGWYKVILSTGEETNAFWNIAEGGRRGFLQYSNVVKWKSVYREVNKNVGGNEAS